MKLRIAGVGHVPLSGQVSRELLQLAVRAPRAVRWLLETQRHMEGRLRRADALPFLERVLALPARDLAYFMTGVHPSMVLCLLHAVLERESCYRVFRSMPRPVLRRYFPVLYNPGDVDAADAVLARRGKPHRWRIVYNTEPLVKAARSTEVQPLYALLMEYPESRVFVFNSQSVELS
ncbi:MULTISPECIES: hypothetical protein [Bacteria]|uniref:hypothetical protein n=1 Tax=Pseudomonadati TaxID=3379134 RepID=UPI000223D0EA|nr:MULTISPECIES: hypothetical protein [Bacteria]AEN74740.1 hypothetical protein Rhom172_2861 [Rhodothermus marinus SG0.5JP17-172]